ncbi:MAG: septal ring lytic transglycosylase RlpA family protein [Alphaproteobacteria bacterium]|jgi:rare lipoprotein A|nr:septal ring lytic transglycosylase RlpA family protein [Alphaproteobacteria bacterium]MCV6599726.1 septal ring lytic transglycosylase RlpA family protein [Alphaproteobacteria bacterium]
MKKSILILVCLFLLSGCTGVRLVGHVFKLILPFDNTEEAKGVYKVGNPYVINGVKYYPKEDWEYDKIGVASWYGGGDDDFHGKKTANGEIYNTRAMTAAHKTLPMPCFVRVTNLKNGRRVILRINDRGPYVKNRIIDVSQKAAELLGFDDKGTTKVRVQILGKESKKIARLARRGKDISNIKYPKDVRKIKVVENDMDKYIYKSEPVLVNKNIYVQAGSFSIYENAEKMKLALEQLGNVKLEEIVINGSTYHRVQIGPMASIEEADSMLNVLSGMGINSSKITIK